MTRPTRKTKVHVYEDQKDLCTAMGITYCDVDVPPGARKSLLDITAQACDDTAYKKLSCEKKATLVENMRAHKESQMQGKRLTVKSQAHDVAHTLCTITTKANFIFLTAVFNSHDW